ncbi:hypothetical protein BDFB_002273, partial [Asbolus verrucosus]
RTLEDIIIILTFFVYCAFYIMGIIYCLIIEDEIFRWFGVACFVSDVCSVIIPMLDMEQISFSEIIDSCLSFIRLTLIIYISNQCMHEKILYFSYMHMEFKCFMKIYKSLLVVSSSQISLFYFQSYHPAALML